MEQDNNLEQTGHKVNIVIWALLILIMVIVVVGFYFIKTEINSLYNQNKLLNKQLITVNNKLVDMNSQPSDVSENEVDKNITMHEFVSSQWGMSFNYPSTWFIIKDEVINEYFSQNKTVYIGEIEVGKYFDSILKGMSITVNPGGRGFASDVIYEASIGQDDSGIIVQSKRLTGDGSFKDSNPEIYLAVIKVNDTPSNGNSYFIELSLLESESATNDQLIDDILTSFRFF